MSKITFVKGSWGDYTAFIDGVEFKHNGFSKHAGVVLDKCELLEQILAQMGIEVETQWHYYLTEEVDGKLQGVRYDRTRSNMKETA